MEITFLLNGETVTLSDPAPTTTLLDWLREEQGLTGTKEGCNEGDCGACTVLVQDSEGARSLNACILFLPQLHGKAVRTVEGIAPPDGSLHPVQQAMIDHHGSQCGFCTPGFITTMATNHLNGETDHATALAGNLCRCTGYAPILRAARAAETTPVPAHLSGDTGLLSPVHAPVPNQPVTLEALAEWYAENPEGTLIAGATDVGLWVTKQFRDLGPVAFLSRCTDLQQIEITPKRIRLGAGVTLTAMLAALGSYYPSLGALLRRYGSEQVRNAATIGGNIANGSPVGDGPPALMALGATLHLRHRDGTRDLPLEDFFLDYGKQDKRPGEFVEAVSFPRAGDHLVCHKLSKRFDQDISAVCGCFWLDVQDGHLANVRLAFGGMAGIPKRASQAEAAMAGKPWTEATIREGMEAMAGDFTPLSDMRASAGYRMETARNMLLRSYFAREGQSVEVRG